MISIIVCSRKPDIPDNLKFNVTETIGVDYELIVIDNSENKYSIFSAYNEGVRRAKYPYLCFMHEDILFHTEDWGVKVIEHFKDPTIGLIGVVGSHYMPRLPGAHWSSGISSVNIIHNIKSEISNDLYLYRQNENECKNAVLIDGVWLCLRSELFGKIKFDDVLFNGFHCYDSDISLQVLNNGFKNIIVFDIKIEHKSLGTRDKSWIYSIFKLHNKWKHVLPLKTIELSDPEISRANFNNALELKQQIKTLKIERSFFFKTFIYYFSANPLINKMNTALFVKFSSKRIYNFLKRHLKIHE